MLRARAAAVAAEEAEAAAAPRTPQLETFPVGPTFQERANRLFRKELTQLFAIDVHCTVDEQKLR